MPKLRLTNKAIRILADEHDLDLFSGTLESKLNLQEHGMEPFVRIFWAGRLWEQRDASIEEARAICEELTPGELMLAVRIAIRESMGLSPEASPEEGEPFPQPAEPANAFAQ